MGIIQFNCSFFSFLEAKILKKTLLASALMLAFASSANAYEVISNQYVENATEVTKNLTTNAKERVLGGSFLKANATELESNLEVTGGSFNMIVGGHYANKQGEISASGASTSLTIAGSDVYAKQVVGGSVGSGNHNFVTTTTETNLTIKDGEFGLATPNTNCPEDFVVAGDLLKWSTFDEGNSRKGNGTSTVGTANLTISGGTFESVIIGGSAAAHNYDSKGQFTTTVETSNVTITGGEFNKPIVAGGLAFGSDTKSTVGTANLSITGVTVSDVYSGGIYGQYTGATNQEATVGSANIEIKNATIGNFYGNALKWELFGGNAPFSEKFTSLTDEVVSTKLSLTNVNAQTVQVMKGEVNLRAEDGKQTKITEALTVDPASVTVSLTTDGATNDKYAGDISKAIVINGWDYRTAEEVKMEEGLVMGEVTMVDGKLVEKTNRVQLATLDMASALPVAMGRILMNDVRKRLGDIRSAEGTHGVWARYDGGEMSGDNNFESKFHTIQVGIDTVPTPDSGRFGVAFSYTKGDSEFGRGESDMDAFSLAAYGTWIADNGMFADVIGRMATIDNDLTIDNSIGAKMDNVLLSLSGEIGWRFNTTETFYLEPQAELTYTYVNSDRFTLNTVEYDVDATDSLIGRIGFAAGLKCPDNFGDVYVRASAVHEFLGDSAVQAAAAKPVELDGEDTWVEFGIGANFNINKNTYVYADIERTEGAKLEEDWRANVGVRFAF